MRAHRKEFLTTAYKESFEAEFEYVTEEMESEYIASGNSRKLTLSAERKPYRLIGIREEGMYLVIICYKCGRYLLAKTDQKTRRCPYCEARLVLNRAKRVMTAKTASQASNILRSLKEKRRAKMVQ